MATNKSNITTIDDEAADETTIEAIPTDKAAPVEVKGTNHDDQLCGDKVRIEISEGQDDQGKEDVLVQINGYAYQIKRGVEVIVPTEVLHILENASMTIYDAAKGGGNNERKVKRFTYSVLARIPKGKK